MKKSILFVINNLNCGGAEKALISLLETLDYSKVNVDLYLFKQEGMFLSKVPIEVNILDEPKLYDIFNMPIKKALFTALRSGRLSLAINRLLAGYVFKYEKNGAKCEQRVWKYKKKSLDKIPKDYDLAVGYLEKGPIYFCVDMVNAKTKVGFIHNDYVELGMKPKYDQEYFRELDWIYTVSNECANVLEQTFPHYKQKINVMHNIISTKVLHRLAKEELKFNLEGIKICSIGRLNAQKGFDLAIGACKRLVDEGINIKWYVLGEGEEREKLEKLINENNLWNHFFLLGLKENPYPYVKTADIYVQSSRFEGKSIAIDEAKILHKPIVVTNFSTSRDQIDHEKNGLIVGMGEKEIAEGIKRLIEDKKLKDSLVQNLLEQDLGTETEINKLYSII
ncbi:glycosyltransferase [Bacillus haimaensis]|uniref:glycosyltransferase n=1 Tax=Bacillus haimaensis TaxID=3160967 RepID=UPI003AA8A589